MDYALEQRLAAEMDKTALFNSLDEAELFNSLDKTALFNSLAASSEQTREQARQQQLGTEVLRYGTFGNESWVPF